MLLKQTKRDSKLISKKFDDQLGQSFRFNSSITRNSGSQKNDRSSQNSPMRSKLRKKLESEFIASPFNQPQNVGRPRLTARQRSSKKDEKSKSDDEGKESSIKIEKK